MSTLTFLADRDYRDFGGISSVSSHGLKVFVYTSSFGYSIAVKGTGLTYDAQSHLMGGTITSVTVSFGASQVATWTGLSFSASQYASLAFATTPDLVTLSRAMLSGADVVNGGPFDSHLSGAAGNDTLNGGTSNDWLFGGSGGDRYFGGAGTDGVSFDSDEPGGHGVTVNLTLTTAQVADDGFGNVETATGIENWEGSAFGDSITGSVADERMWGLSGNDTLHGGGGGDWLVGNAGNDSIFGDAGSDLLFGDSGRDSYFGGDGSDFVIFQSGDPGLHGAIIDMMRVSGQVRNDGFGNVETMKGVENLVLTKLNDRATGSAADNVIFGNYGNDTLIGMNGADSLIGNAGDDRLTGGKGADRFIFDDSLDEAGVDHITDMKVGTDKIAVNHDWASDMDLGAIVAAQFRAGQSGVQATTASQRFLYDHTTGSLFFDADGVGGVAAVKFAVLDNLAAITFADIVIVTNF